ncbi:endonuclease/exonuclease/phosphatase family protein [Streptomyces thinghirensis]|nr:endonuclease/exonuclease/phosphatase family protein [Streptomyces thinghirensis]
MTWNLWWRFGPWADRQKAILAVLAELRPDVVGLQEVWAADDGGNLAEWLAGELGLHCAWAASEAPERWQRRIGDDTVGIGTAVLSRWPVVERTALRLPAPEELDDGRLALYARLDAPGHPVPFFTAHLNSGGNASAVRREQAAALAEFVAAHRHGTAFPPVVTGDFNATPDSAEVRLLTRPAPAAPGRAAPARRLGLCRPVGPVRHLGRRQPVHPRWPGAGRADRLRPRRPARPGRTRPRTRRTTGRRRPRGRRMALRPRGGRRGPGRQLTPESGRVRPARIR